MTKNESTVDRAVRAGISVTALGAGLSLGGIFTPPGAALLGVSVVSGVTAATFCGSLRIRRIVQRRSTSQACRAGSTARLITG